MAKRRVPQLSRREFLRLSALAAGVGVLAACAPPGAAPAAPAAPEAAEKAAPAPARPADAAKQQVLRIATGSTGAASFTFYPMQGGGDQQNWMPLLYVPPLYFDVDLNLQPGVFSSWKNNEDFTVWTFTIDPRAKWSDNTSITAEQVKGTWELMTDPLSRHGRIPQYLGNVQGYDEVREQSTTDMSGLVVLDDRTIPELWT